jgi:hypothetical protein
VINASHFQPQLRKAAADSKRPGAGTYRKALRMSYATPFYHAAKALDQSVPTHAHHPRYVKTPRRPVRLALFPALRARTRRAAVATASPSSSR